MPSLRAYQFDHIICVGKQIRFQSEPSDGGIVGAMQIAEQLPVQHGLLPGNGTTAVGKECVLSSDGTYVLCEVHAI
jgi:hypothetical protein